MYFKCYQGEVEPQRGYEIPGVDDGAQRIQMTQVQIAQIVSKTVRQEITQLQQISNNLSLATAANHVPQNTTAVQQVQPPIKFDVSAFEGDSAASWLTWSALCAKLERVTLRLN